MYLKFTDEEKLDFEKDIQVLKRYMTKVDFDILLNYIAKKKNKLNFLKISDPKVKRSVEQNAYYWGAVIPFIHKLKLFPKLALYQLSDDVEVKDGIGVSCQELYHGVLSNEFLGYNVGTKKEIKKGVIRSSSLSISSFEIYLILINEWVQEQTGLHIPSPDEFENWTVFVANPHSTQEDFFNHYIKTNS